MASHEYEYLIALGSNTGDRADQLNRAVEAIQSILGPVTALSAIYETEPMGAADALFLNAATRVLSNMPPDKSMAALLEIEKNLGRIRTEKWGNRSIDLDILLVHTQDSKDNHTQAMVSSESLTIPHPEMLHRDFVMIPAAEVAGDWIHPTTQRTLAEEAADRFSALKKLDSAIWVEKNESSQSQSIKLSALTPTFI